MQRRFITADVFTDRPLAGNPLAIVLDCDGLDDAAMQALAREFNLSETVFVLPAGQADHAARIRIFTPGREVPFAGHPTIGTALVLAGRGLIEVPPERPIVVLGENVGPVPVRLVRKDGRYVFAELEAPQAPELRDAPPAAAVAPIVGLEPADLVTDRGLPAGASAGLPFLIVEVGDRAALARAALDRAAWAQELRGTFFDHVYLVSRDAPHGFDFQVRMFAPGAGVEEDPATGSAAAAFGGWLGERGGFGDGRHRFVIAQGVEMGRPSRLEVVVERAAGRLQAVRVGGSAVTVMAGTLEIG